MPSDTDFGAPPPLPFGFSNGNSRQHLQQCETSEELDQDADLESNDQKQQQICKSRDQELHGHHHGLLNYNNDQHSSEEELEVINSPKVVASQGCRPATAPEKRKWSQVSNSGGGPQAHCSSQNQAQQQQQHRHKQAVLGGDAGVIAASCSAPVSRAGREPAGSGSSDEEVRSVIFIHYPRHC